MRFSTASLRRLAAPSMVFALGLSLFAAATGEAARPRSAPEALSASQLLSTALANATARGSFHSVETVTVAGTHSTVVADAGRTVGRQRLTDRSGGRAEVLVINKVAYISGNRQGWVSTLGFPSVVASFLGNGAARITPSSSTYGPVAAAVTLQSALAQLKLTGDLTATQTTFRGQAVTAISGKAPAADGGGPQTVYVSHSSHPLPVYVKLTVTGSGQHGAGGMTLEHWGERVALTPPANPVSIKALPAVIAASEGVASLHYESFTGSRGYPPPAGRPWVGAQCKPIRLAVASGVPSWIYPQVAKVVAEARADGIDVTLDGRNGSWDHSSLYYKQGQSPKTAAGVEIHALNQKPPKGGKQHIEISWGTKLSGHNEQFTHVAGTLLLKKVDGHALSLRRAIRQLIALTQGVAGTNLHGSAIASLSKTDHFTVQDIAAMLQMSGCVKQSSTGITSLGSAPTTVTTPTTSTTGVPFKWH